MDLLKDIRYIFQIPLEWFKRVDARVFGDHPGSGILFEPASDGSRAVMLDFHVLDSRYGGGSSGTVASVDGVGPNASGNVVLNALVEDDLGLSVARQEDLQTVLNDYLTSEDLNGYATQAWVGQQGFLTSASLNGYATQAWVGQQGFLTSIPSNVLLTTDRNSTSNRGVSPYYHANIVYTGNLPGAVDNLYDWCGAYTSGATNVTSSTLSSDLNNLSDAVLRDSDRGVSGGVMSYDYNLANLLNSSGRVNLSKIETLTASKWMKTDASGNISTTNDTPLSADSSKTGFVLNTAGTISYVSGKSGTTNVSVVTGISWNGTQIIATNSKLTFSNGLLTSVSSLSNTVINTVTY